MLRTLAAAADLVIFLGWSGLAVLVALVRKPGRGHLAAFLLFLGAFAALGVLHLARSLASFRGADPEGRPVVALRVAVACCVAASFLAAIPAARAGRLLQTPEVLTKLLAEKMAVESELRVQEERFRTIATLVANAVVVGDGDGRVVFWNRAAEKAFGLAAAEALGTLIFDIFPARHRRTMVAVFSEAASDAPRPAGDWVNVSGVRHDGEEFEAEVAVSHWRSAAGAEYVMVVARDLGERKRAARALAASEEKFRTIADNVKDYAIFMLDADGLVTTWNAGAERIKGYREDEVVGRHVSMFYPPGRGAEADDLIRAAAADGRAEADGWRVRRDGTAFRAHVVLTALRVPGGRPAGFLKIVRDVTRERQAEEELRLANAALAISNDDLQQFAYVASHDLQAPLRTIASYSGLLERRLGDRLDDDTRGFVRTVVANAKKMQALINDILAYSRAATQAAPPRPVRVADALAQAVANCEADIGECGASVRADGPLPVVMGDPAQLAQVMTNLVANAVKFRRPGVAPEVTVSAEPCAGGAGWKVLVRDNGVGLDRSQAGRLFQMFQRLHPQSAYPGTGVGLAICRRVVERLGGKIGLESSEPGVGTTFFFTLPGAP
jgi:PAS domain S-box-containing protein